ncbi:hypothetical protein AB205_0200090, partial [Aquarana catesbeiana]
FCAAHCRPIVCLEGQQGEADSHKPIKEGKQALCLEATVLVVDMVHLHQHLTVLSRNMRKTWSSGWPCRPHPPHPLTQAQGTLSGKAAANVASSLGSMASVTPSLAPPCPSEESLELFDHSVGYMLQEDAQRFKGSDDGTQLEENSNVSPNRGGAQEGQQSGSHVPPAAAYCQVCSSDEEGGDDEVTGSTWVPDRREEEAHHQRGRMPSRGQPKGSTLTASHRRAPHVQGAAVSALYSKSSLVWAFFETSASDRTSAICNICLKRISRGQNISRLGTTCLTRHMLTCHAVHWQ